MDQWEVFDELEPIGMHQLHRLLALLIMHTAANAQIDVKITDLCPWLSPDP